MEVNKLMACHRGAPLSLIVRDPLAESFLSPLVYKIYHGIYLKLVLFNPDTFEKDPDGPFVMGVVWAASDGAARRALLMEIESDDGAMHSVPNDFLPASDATTYSTILQGLKNVNPRVCQETAAYRIASDRRFIHRIIETERFAFFFRNPKHDDSELPYAIIRKLI
jgi:hypothetical protein